MADTKISALPDASQLDGTETVAVVQSGVTKKATPRQLSGVPGLVTIAAPVTVTLFDPRPEDANGVPFGWFMSSHAWTNGPVGETNYTDSVWGMGHNVAAPGVPAVSGKPGFGNFIESKYYQADGLGNTVFLTEWQLRGIRSDGTQFRPLEIDAPHSGTGNVAGWRVSRMFLGTESVGADLSTTVVVDIKPKGADTAGDAVITIIPLATHVDGGRALQVQFPDVTNKGQKAFACFGSTNWALSAEVSNTRSGGSAGLVLSNNGAGYAYNQAFSQSSAQSWAWGKDASDHWALSAATVPSSSNRVLLVDKTNLNVAFSKPPKMPSSTVASAPSASTYGAGSLHMMTDATATTPRSTPTGGGSNKVVCFSDGTNWLILA